MGAAGEDVQLSQAAYNCFGYSVECKSLKKVAVYNYYEQGQTRGGERLVVIKGNGKQPLAIVDFEHFMDLVKIASSKIRKDEMDGKLK